MPHLQMLCCNETMLMLQTFHINVDIAQFDIDTPQEQDLFAPWNGCCKLLANSIVVTLNLQKVTMYDVVKQQSDDCSMLPLCHQSRLTWSRTRCLSVFFFANSLASSSPSLPPRPHVSFLLFHSLLNCGMWPVQPAKSMAVHI